MAGIVSDESAFHTCISAAHVILHLCTRMRLHADIFACSLVLSRCWRGDQWLISAALTALRALQHFRHVLSHFDLSLRCLPLESGTVSHQEALVLAASFLSTSISICVTLGFTIWEFTSHHMTVLAIHLLLQWLVQRAGLLPILASQLLRYMNFLVSEVG